MRKSFWWYESGIYLYTFSFVYTCAQLGELIQWDGHHTYLNTWPGGSSNSANLLRGTEGLFFRPLLKEGDSLIAFIDDVQRSFDLVYTGKVKHLHTEAFRYRVDNSTFKSAFRNPANARYGSWNPDGLIYLGPTQYPEIPVFGSKPHYLDGDPELRSCCIGMTEPNRDIHDITVDVEPTTGANIQVKQILQVNVQVNQSKHFEWVNVYLCVCGDVMPCMFIVKLKTLLAITSMTTQRCTSQYYGSVRWVFVSTLSVIKRNDLFVV